MGDYPDSRVEDGDYPDSRVEDGGLSRQSSRGRGIIQTVE